MRLVLALALLACGCPGTGAINRPYPTPTPEAVTAQLVKKNAELTSFVADSTMDYWLGNQRMKGEVLVMGTPGARVRFAAQSPAGGATMLEMACNGQDFVLVDYQNNCALSGPCDASSIAQFFHISLTPDDFFHLAVGAPPILENATGTLSWDSSHGYEKLVLKSAAGTQKLTIDMKGNRTDVIDSELEGPDGKVIWSVANTDFTQVAGHRVPGKTRFKSPNNQQDLLVEWGDSRQLNTPLDNSKFVLEAPAGLPMCGQTVQMKPAPGGAGSGAHP